MDTKKILIALLLFTTMFSFSQGKDLPKDFLPSKFHKERRALLRSKMPNNSVAVFFANPSRNRANDVDYLYHQDPNFYYLTGSREPNAVLLIFSEKQQSAKGLYNELFYVEKKTARAEVVSGPGIGIDGAQKLLGFKNVFYGKDFATISVDFSKFDKVIFEDFKNDVRDDKRTDADLYDLILTFKTKISYQTSSDKIPASDKNIKLATNIDVTAVKGLMATLREVKTKEELVLLKKAVRISAMGQVEIMKAMHPKMSETEVQGIHEFVYKKYGAEYEGYPSIVGAGNNGCILHYQENNKMSLKNDLVLMDLGAEYRGYTADVTRTIPANGKFSKEQKLIYDLVYEAQEAGIAQYIIEGKISTPGLTARKIINEGLYKLGIIKSVDEKHPYFPHGTSHHIGLDVHDPGNYTTFAEDMVLTMEPGIYIPEGSKCDKKWWGIGVRIEDDILITKNGPIILSADAPRKSDEIEKMMQQKSIFETYTLPDLDKK
ncbi:Xaa-Pro aminopeptidase [Polaribacter huanghezhanensis]|uniref:aminopeptidase P N-terminal domain-containing protein n=1 Tax=Polaribacter huanghezhanensis TaxID=1354726 RepID=UPI00264790A4|nr:aminopeptidase P N-terminal domain-containing protein [Polaribacter huanghezhanensis]WKD86700.1 Xaa-Pro aminopeptidase [Polaribacter huanghezhanensis]